MSFASSSNVGLYIHPRNGNVGIGTTQALTAFHVRANTATAGVVIDQAGAGGILDIRDAGVSKVFVDGNGNVGIGTIVPTSKFSVVGEVSSTSLRIATPNNAVNYLVLNFKDTDNYGIYAQSDSIGFSGSTLRFLSRDYNYGANNIRDILTMRPEGRVGIGTTNPQYPLDVNGNTRLGVSATVSSHTIYGKPYIYSTHNASVPSYDPSYGDYGDLTIINTTSGRILHLGANTGYCYLQSVNPFINTESIVLQPSGGFVGIGVTNPSAQLTIFGVGQNTSETFNTSGSLGGTLTLIDSQGAFNSGGAIIFGCPQGSFAAIKANLINGINNSAGRLSFYTRTATTDATLTNRMTIAENGYVGIGKTNPQFQLHLGNSGSYSYIRGDGNSGIIIDATNNAVYLSIASDVKYYANHSSFSPNGDNIRTLGGSGARWSVVYAVNGTIQTSDERLKDYSPLTYGLNEVLNIETIKYKWKSQSSLPDTDPMKNYEYYGFKASNLDTLFPELVYNESDTLQVNYTELIPVLVKAIQEQQQEIQQLKADHAALLQRVLALEHAAAGSS